MSFLPIVTRELRLRAHRRSTYWWRCGAALAAAAIAAVMMVAALVIGPGKVGKAMFAAMAWLAWLFCLVEGVRNTADCLSEEKREGTLGLLFLTDLKGYDVALGKFVAASLGAFFPFLAVLPLLGMSLLMGGVTFGEFWRMTLALTHTLFFGLAAGLFVSSISRRERQAWMGSLLLMAFFTVGLPLLGSITGWLGAVLALASPWTIFTHAFNADYVRNPPLFWHGILLVHLLSWLWLALAGLFLTTSWQDKTPAGTSAAGRPSAAGTGLSVRQASQRNRRLALNPAFWLAVREGSRGRLLWLSAIAASVAGLVLGGMSLTQPGAMAALWAGALGLHLLAAVWMAWEASHSFGELRNSGLLELLMSTPLQAAAIVQGQQLALRRLFFGPVALLAGTELAVAGTFALHDAASQGLRAFLDVIVVNAVVAFGILLWVLDLMAVAQTGLWFGLVSRRPGQAWAKTVLWVLAGPVLLSLPLIAICCGAIFVPVVLPVKDILFINWAKGKLRSDFCALAGSVLK